MRRSYILDAQQYRRYGKKMRSSDLPDELPRRHHRLEQIRQVPKDVEVVAAAAEVRQRQEEAYAAKSKTDGAKEADAPATQQVELNLKVEAAAAKALDTLGPA